MPINSNFIVKFLLLALLSSKAILGGHSVWAHHAQEKIFQIESIVYLPNDTNDEEIKSAIKRQLKTAVGSLREQNMALKNFDPLLSPDHIQWQARRIEVVDIFSNNITEIKQINYIYTDQGITSNFTHNTEPINAILLANDYQQYDHNLTSELIDFCTPGFDDNIENIWYYFSPSLTTCQDLIERESLAIESQKELISIDQKLFLEVMSRFIAASIWIKDDPQALPLPSALPKVMRQRNKSPLNIFLIHGADVSDTIINDRFGEEYIKFLHNIFLKFPHSQVIRTKPETDILDIKIKGEKIRDLDYQNLFRWMIDPETIPPEIRDDPQQIMSLQIQVMQKFSKRFISWELRDSAMEGSSPIVLHSYYGYEWNSVPDRQQYIDHINTALNNGDIIIYNGHSFMGEAAINSLNYKEFSYQSQLVFINSCNSYSFFSDGLEQLLNNNPDNNYEIIVNAHSSPIHSSGDVIASFLLSMLAGQDYPTIFQNMDAVEHAAIDPLRLLISRVEEG